VRLYCVVTLIAIVMCGNACVASPSRIREAEKFPADKVLTLNDCINLALKNQPSVRQAAAQVEFQAGAVSQARSRLLPTVSANSSTFLAGSGRNSGTSVNAGVDQLIYDFGRSPWGLSEAERQRMASVAAYISAKADTILDVKRSYYTLLRTTDLVSVFEENLKSAEGHVNQAQERLNAGLAPKSDLLKAQAASASARVDLVTARNNRDQAHVNLNVAMGVDVRSAMRIAETAEAESPVPDADKAVDTALLNRPEARKAQAQVGAAEAALKSAKTGNLPAFTTSVSDFRSFGGESLGTTNGLNSNSNSWEWTLNTQWRPFDSGLTRGAVKEARAQLVTVEESYYTVKQTIGSDVVSARFDLLAAQEALVSAKAEVASAREDLDSATGRYNAGIAIFLEVTDAQAVLLKAQVDELVARYGISIARAGLEHAIGATSVGGTGK
jgi:outer membrane protein